jgi:hypothetical protein
VEGVASDEGRRAVLEDEGAAGEAGPGRGVAALAAGRGLDPGGVEEAVELGRLGAVAVGGRQASRKRSWSARRHSAQGRWPAASATASSRKKSSV